MKLSVIVPAYNLESYIEKCLVSILEQETTFSFEVICIDDASTDDTAFILNDLKCRYSNLKILRNELNLGLAKSQKKLLSNASGEYIAYLDGDDFALPGKLQTQVDYLNSNSNCSLVYHESEVFESLSGKFLGHYSRDFYNSQYIPQVANVEHLIQYGCFINASSVMFRRHNKLLDAVDEGCKIILDYPWHIMNLLYLRGSVDFIDCVYGKYRIHDNSFGGQTRKSPDRRVQSMKDQVKAVQNALSFGISTSIIDKGIAHHRFATAIFFLKQGQFELFQKFIVPTHDSNMFFDDRHRFAFKNKENPNMVLKELFSE